ncbi:hypothetical protein DW039_07955 [Bacteroides sp. AF39-16AC]|nr:hypothetical protein DW039_07955 [Bacteroides sp. AF39-16AC]
MTGIFLDTSKAIFSILRVQIYKKLRYKRLFRWKKLAKCDKMFYLASVQWMWGEYSFDMTFLKIPRIHGFPKQKTAKNVNLAQTSGLKTTLKTANERAALLSSTNGM